MIRYTRQHLTLVNIVGVSDVFMINYFKTAAPLLETGNLGKVVLTILMIVTFKMVKQIYI